MPTPKQLSKYPPEFFELAQRALTQDLTVNCGSGDDARRHGVQIRQRFNAFCRLVCEQHHPHEVFCSRTSVSLKEVNGEWLLTFYNSQSGSTTSKLLREALGPQQPTPQAPIQSLPPTEFNLPPEEPLSPTENPMESALEKLGYFTGASKKDSK